MSEQNLNQQQPTDALNVPQHAGDTSQTLWGAIIGGVLVGLSFILSFSQDGKPLLFFSEPTVILGAIAAVAGGIAPFIGPKQKATTAIVVSLAGLALAAALYYIVSYEQAVSELQRQLSGF